MENILNSNVIEGIVDVTYEMWKKGWDEANGGNISYILDQGEIEKYKNQFSEKGIIDVVNIPVDLVGKYAAITATLSQFRTVKDNPESDIGIIKILKNGYQVVWGFENNRRPTSELYMHLLSHNARLKVNPKHRVVVHNHANNATAYSLVVDPDDQSYTLPLWQVLTESIVVFPDGVGVLPWELPGTEEIGLKTAKKLEECRIVVWTFHGILATGTSFQDCFGLIDAYSVHIKPQNRDSLDQVNRDSLYQLSRRLLDHFSFVTIHHKYRCDKSLKSRDRESHLQLLHHPVSYATHQSPFVMTESVNDAYFVIQTLPSDISARVLWSA